MTTCLAQSNAAWAEDTALLRSNRSADPGAKTGGGIKPCCSIPPVSPSLRDWQKSEKPSRQEAAKSPTGSHLQLTNANPPEFQFPLNQDIPEKAVPPHPANRLAPNLVSPSCQSSCRYRLP